MSNLPKGWEEIQLFEVGKIITGKTPSKDNPEDWGSKYNFITPTDIKDDSKFIEKTNRFISEEGKNRFQNMLLDEYSIIVTCIGSDMGKVVINKDIALTNQQINSIIINASFDKDFIYYKLKSEYKLLKRLAGSGSTMPLLNKSDFSNIKIDVPETLEEQKEIANILSSFDKKIELLKEQNQTLETMAQTIFKEWFVDFNYPNATSEMIDSEMGEIPKGWSVGKIEDIVNIYDSQRIPLSSQERELKKGIYPYYGATKVLDYIDDFLFDGTYLLFAEDGSVSDANGKPILQYVWGKFWVNNHTHILQGKNGFSTELLYIAFKNINVSSIITGAVQLKINQGNLLNYKILIPDKFILNNYIQLLNPIFRKFKSNFEQIQILEETRDSLLPKLMSGRIRVFEYDN